METTPPQPPPLLSPTTMDSLARVDLANLHTDAVIVYANRVVQLPAARTSSPENLQLLFVLSQKLIRWFMDERREMERLNCVLEETLLESLAAQSTPADTSPEPGDTASIGDIKLSIEVDAPNDNITSVDTPGVSKTVERVECGVHVQADVFEAASRTDVEKRSVSSTTVETQTETAALFSESSTQVEAATCTTEDSVQTDDNASVTVETQTETVEAATTDDAVQTDIGGDLCIAETQTELAAEGIDCGVQAEELTMTVEGSVQTEAHAAERVECSVQVEAETSDNIAQTNAGADLCVVETQTDACSISVECSVQVESVTVDHAAQTDPRAENCPAETQTVAVETAAYGVQVHADVTNGLAQTHPSPALVDGSTQDERPLMAEGLTQTERGATVVDGEAQVEMRLASVEESVQTCDVVSHADGTVQTELVVASTSAQTVGIAVADSETQVAVCEMADHETSTRDDFDSVDLAVQATEAEWIVVAPPSTSLTRVLPLDVYFQVHRSIIRLQRIARGYMTRRRFYRMLNELVHAK